MALRKIGKSVALERRYDEFRSQVLESLELESSPLEKTVNEIVNELNEDEKGQMRSDSEWVEKVKELVGLRRDHGMYESLAHMMRKLGVGEVRP